MSVRSRIKQFTKAQFAAMSAAEVERHVASVLREASAAKKRGDTRDLTYLYKALPGDRKTPEMKRRILPFDLSTYKKKAKAKRGQGSGS